MNEMKGNIYSIICDTEIETKSVFEIQFALIMSIIWRPDVQ